MILTIRELAPGNLPARFDGARRATFRGGLVLAWLLLSALPAHAQKITEVVAHHAGAQDDHEYIEVAADPASVHPTGNSGTVPVSLSTYTLVELDGTSDPGKVLHSFPVGTTNGSGFWSTGYLTSTLEKPTFTILLVQGYSDTAAAAVGYDLDAGNDGILDATPWMSIADGVAFSDGSAGARTYAAPVLGPGFDGAATAPNGASRFPYWNDTDSVTDWKRNDFDGDGLPGFTGTLASGEARNTPGSVNRVSLADYYAGIDASSQAALRTSLHARIGNHIRYPYTSSTTDTWDILNLAEQDPIDSGKILDIYKNATYTKITGGTGVYNREHSWPNSYGFNDATATSEYTDCHHLFASDTGYNSNRGNQPFGTCSSGCTENVTDVNHGFGGGSGTYPGNSNWWNGSVYEVWSHMKGNLARASLYMDVRYEGGAHPYTGTTETNLQLTDTLSQIQTNQPYMGLRSVLLAWHAADPPDDAERRRNDVVESFQGNRNPFVDHPEWVSCVFQGTGCQTVTGPPVATTNAATVIATTGGTLNGSVNPSGLATTASFEWGLTTAYGQTTTSQTMGSGSSAVPIAATISGLVPCTTYHFRVTATNSGGTTNGGDLSFTTTCPAPSVTTEAASGVTTTGATLNGTVNPNGVATSASFEWGTTTAYGQTTSVQSMGAGSLAQPLAAAVTGLAPCTTVHYRTTATSAGGTVTGQDGTFTTTCTGRFHPLEPCRVIDTRNSSVVRDGVPRVVTFQGVCQIPSSAKALAANISVTEATRPGQVSVYPADVPSSGTSVVHFSVGKVRASQAMIKLSGSGQARLEATVPSGGTVQVIVDVSGYFD